MKVLVSSLLYSCMREFIMRVSQQLRLWCYCRFCNSNCLHITGPAAVVPTGPFSCCTNDGLLRLQKLRMGTQTHHIRSYHPLNIRKLSMFAPLRRKGTGEKPTFRSLSSLFPTHEASAATTLESLEANLEAQIRKGPVSIEEYCTVLEALAQESNKGMGGAPQRAEVWMKQLLEQVEKQKVKQHDKDEGNLLLRCWNAVVWTWANNTREKPTLCVTRAELWLEQIAKHKHKPNTQSFHGLLHACSKGRSKSPKTLESLASKAQDTLRHMQELNVPVNTDTYNYVIRAWTRCRTDQATGKVMDLLREMEQHSRKSTMTHSDPHSEIYPNTISYGMAMDAWANLAGRRARKHEQDPKQNQDRDDELDSRNGIYQVRQVEALLEYIHNLHDFGVPHVEPNTVVYNTCISAWTRISSKRNNSDEDSNNMSPPLEAEKILRKMQTQLAHVAPPDSISYTRVILAWAKSHKTNAGIRANFWLEQLWQRYVEQQQKDGNDDVYSNNTKNHNPLLPRVDTYNAVIQAWANAGNVSRAEAVLEEMVSSGTRTEKEKTGIVPPLPNTASYSHVVFAWLREEKERGDGEACQRAAEWLDRLIEKEKQQQGDKENDQSSDPARDVVLVTTSPEMFEGILKAAAHSQKHADGQPNLELLDLAIGVFDQYRASRHIVGYKAYEWMLQLGLDTFASREYDGDARKAFIHQLVQDCCQDGLVSNVFVRALANGTVYYSGWTVEESDKLTRELLPWPLPSWWSRNVSQKHNLPRPSDLKRTNFNVQD